MYLLFTVLHCTDGFLPKRYLNVQYYTIRCDVMRLKYNWSAMKAHSLYTSLHEFQRNCFNGNWNQYFPPTETLQSTYNSAEVDMTNLHFQLATCFNSNLKSPWRISEKKHRALGSNLFKECNSALHAAAPTPHWLNDSPHHWSALIDH